MSLTSTEPGQFKSVGITTPTPLPLRGGASSAATSSFQALGEFSALGARVIPDLADEAALPQATALHDDVDAEARQLDAFARAHAAAGIASLEQLRERDEGELGAVGMHAGDRA